MSQFKFGDIVSYNGKAWMVTLIGRTEWDFDKILLFNYDINVWAAAEKCKLLPKQSNLAECLSQPLCVYKRGDRVVPKHAGMPVSAGIVLGWISSNDVLVSPDADPSSIERYSQSEMNAYFDLAV